MGFLLPQGQTEMLKVCIGHACSLLYAGTDTLMLSQPQQGASVVPTHSSNYCTILRPHAKPFLLTSGTPSKLINKAT